MPTFVRHTILAFSFAISLVQVYGRWRLGSTELRVTELRGIKSSAASIEPSTLRSCPAGGPCCAHHLDRVHELVEARPTDNLLTASLNPLDVAPGDSIRALRSVTYNPLGADLGLDFIIANWVQLDSLYGNIGNGFLTLADVLNTQEHYNKILQFRNEHSSELSLGALTGIQSTLNILEENMAWNFAYLSVVMEYFRIA
ncbi:hypothetical protein B566_EDAN010103 [Ephemera danica]|nr:hypothetical protein B566_EDAN010103 [Ephemera danica]